MICDVKQRSVAQVEQCRWEVCWMWGRVVTGRWRRWTCVDDGDVDANSPSFNASSSSSSPTLVFVDAKLTADTALVRESVEPLDALESLESLRSLRKDGSTNERENELGMR